MDKFLEKWKTDKKYQTKIKLLLYTGFVVIISIYAISLNNTEGTVNLDDETQNLIKDITEENNTQTEDIIKIKEKYNYEIDITINDKEYQYSGTKTPEETTIIKENNGIITKYLYKNDNYYQDIDDTYIITTKDEVYDIISYNYINLENINQYLSKSTNQNNQYLVYLKDIILGNDSDDYFVILVNDNKINIDYTPLMKNFNNNITKYKVNIKISETEETE